MAVSEVSKINRKGFPRDVIEAVNELVDLQNRPWVVQYKTDSADYKAEVIEDPERVTILLPRNPGGTSGGGSKQVIIVDNGVANYYTIPAKFVGPVP